MRLRAITEMMVTLILFSGLIGVFNEPAVVAESIPTTEILYNWISGYSFPTPGIYVIATETNPVEMLRNYTIESDYYKMLKEHVTTEANVEDFISILISRGLFSTAGYGIQIRSVEKDGYSFLLSADFTDPPPGAYLAQVLTNPTALILIGNLPAGEYSITLYIDHYVDEYYYGTETWTATFKCSADWITVTGFEVEMSIENKTTVLGEEISILMVALIGGEFPTSQVFDVYLYDSNYSLFSFWSQDKAFLQVLTDVPSGYNQTLRWDLYRYDGGKYFPPPAGNYYLVGTVVGGGTTPAILIKIDNFTITPIAEEAQPPLVELKTDKTVYALGENVRITLTNIGITYVQIGGYPCVEIRTYPDLEPVWPEVFAWLAWGLAPGESETWIWNQCNEFTESYVEPGLFVVSDTVGWGLSTFFEIAPQPPLQGDFDGDGYVDVSDLFDLSKAYGSKLGDPNWNPDCDFNKDGAVDGSDLFGLSNNYGAT